MTRIRSERGSILVLSAVTLPIFLLFCALVVDAGNWFTHRRQLQNRADAGALAAGVEYLTQLPRCASPGAATAIANAAKRYAGDPDAMVPGPKYNEQVANQSDVTVTVSNPCTPHAADPPISPNPNSIWTNVKVRETNIGTLFAMFGLDLPAIEAQARVQVKQVVGVRGSGEGTVGGGAATAAGALPFVHETGDYVGCVWAEFVDVETGNRVSLVGGQSNPLELVADPNVPRRWTADVRGIGVPSGATAIGVNYWLGSPNGGSCDFSTRLKRKLPGDNNGNATPVDWINVFDDDSPHGGAPPLLHHFTLSPGSCGSDRVGFVAASRACTIAFSAEVDHGSNPAPSSLTVTSSNQWCTSRCVSSVTATPSGGSGSTTRYLGQITYDPTALTGNPVRQNYTQVGQQLVTASWTMTSGSLTTGRRGSRRCTTSRPCLCTNRNPCRAAFDTDIPGNVLHATYVADPVNSSPVEYAELLSGGTPMPNSIAADAGSTGPFTVVFRDSGVDQDHVVLLRGSPRGAGNRSLTISCGASDLDTAIENGCPSRMMVNQRAGSCSPRPPQEGAWDCVHAAASTAPPSAQSLQRRFCPNSNANNWVTGSSPDNLNPSDPRFAYVPLTAFGRTQATDGWFPIDAFVRFYVTGGDGMSCPGDDPAPRGHDNSSWQLWGHLVDVVTLSDDVIVGDQECDEDVAVVNCKPELVR